MSNDVNPTTILIIDDEAAIRQSFADYLEDLGYRALTAENGRVGLEILEREQPDLVLTDLRMPGMNGLEVIRRGSQLAPDIPIVVVSGAGRIGDAIQAVRLGAGDYILKPIEDMSVLEHQVEKALEKARLVRENQMYQENLERMVADRTAQLEATNCALRKSEEKYRSLVTNIPDVTWTTDNEGVTSFVSPNIEKEYGYTPEEIYAGGDSVWFGRIHPQDVGKVGKAFKELFEKGTMFDVEYRIQRKDGEWVWARDRSIGSYERDGVMCADGIFANITERKRAEEALRESEEKYRIQARLMQGIMDTVPEGVLLLDADGRVVLANPVAAGDLTVLAGATVGDTLTRLGDRSLAELLTPPSTKGLWHEVKAGDQTFEVIACPMEPTADGRSENWVLVINDATQEREIERHIQQQERLAAVGQLSAGIAHDFRNLLTTITLYSSMALRRPDLPPKLARNIQTILGESKKAADLVQQILDFSSRSMIRVQALDLQSLIQNGMGLLERTIPENIRLSLGVEPGEQSTAFTVRADPGRIQQALTNLAANARDAMPDGGELRFELSRVEVTADAPPPLADMSPLSSPPLGGIEGGAWVCLAVSDTGMGMTEEVCSHLFEPFFTTKEVGKGTGLGLAQVHGIVRQHEGFIGVETELGRGTTFRIYLPVYVEEADSDRASVKEIEVEESSAPPQGQGETILLVEDNENLREAGQNILESLGYRVLTAMNGREALAIYAVGDEVDLVITDMVMPEMGGKELVRELRRSNPNLKALGITGYAVKGVADELREAGFLDVIHKPFAVKALAQVIHRALVG